VTWHWCTIHTDQQDCEINICIFQHSANTISLTDSNSQNESFVWYFCAYVNYFHIMLKWIKYWYWNCCFWNQYLLEKDIITVLGYLLINFSQSQYVYTSFVRCTKLQWCIKSVRNYVDGSDGAVWGDVWCAVTDWLIHSGLYHMFGIVRTVKIHPSEAAIGSGWLSTLHDY